jgi:hypothetical protein
MKRLQTAILMSALILAFLASAAYSGSRTLDPYATQGSADNGQYMGQQQAAPQNDEYANPQPGQPADNDGVYGYGTQTDNDSVYGYGTHDELGDQNPSGLPPLGGRDQCMGGAGGTDSGGAASSMGSC